MPNQNQLAALIDRLGEDPTIDKLAELLRPVAEAVGTHPLVEDALGQGPTGVPLHPALVHLPIGAAFSAAVLDAVGLGRLDKGTTVLTALVVASAIPTHAAGFHDWRPGAGEHRFRRLGALHGVAAAKGTSLAAASLLARLSGRQRLATLLLWGCCAAYSAAGLLGGELVYGRD